MKVVRGYKMALDLNNTQRTLLLKHAGASRFAYNWGLARKMAAYKVGAKVPSAIDLHRELNTLKQTEYPWMYEVSKCAPQEALRNLDKAYGTVFENPRALKHALKKLRRLEKQKSRRKQGSKNRAKTRQQIATHHARIAHTRLDAAHKLTSYLCKNHALVAIEDVHVAGMLKNHCLAQAVADSNFGEMRHQLEYKAQWHGTHLVTIDRFSPSSKTCSACGSVKPILNLSERTFICEDCGNVLDCDLNAALNRRDVAVSSIDTQNACGVGSSGYLATESETAHAEAGTTQQVGMSYLSK